LGFRMKRNEVGCKKQKLQFHCIQRNQRMKAYVFIGIFLSFIQAFAQQQNESEISVETGKLNLAINQPFILSVVVKNKINRPSVQFPELAGLEKRSASATSTTNTISGKTVLIQTISQQYYALQEGEYEIPSFTITVDGAKVRSEGLTLLFKKGDKEAVSTDKVTQESEIISPEEEIAVDDVFLSVRTSKSSVYVREGFAVRLSIYVAKSAPIEMDFYQLDMQLQSILKKLRPATCWEENVGIEEIIQRDVSIRGQKYTEYQMYQAMFFPFTLQTVPFPAVGLDMLVLDSRSAVAGKKKSIKTFYSKPVRVLVKPLPPHPLRDQVAVGTYDLQEQITKETLSSGESLRYLFTIKGEGNLATITPPDVQSGKAFDFYPPDVNQTVRRSYEKVSGEKTFDYFIVAKQKGTYPLGRFFQWIYFDPRRSRYDTLRSSRTITVVGENLSSVGLGERGRSIYDNIEELDTTGGFVDYQAITRNLTNLVVLSLLGLVIWIFRKQK
jgi:hypothetical protein